MTRALVQASYDYRAAFRFTPNVVLAVGVEEHFLWTWRFQERRFSNVSRVGGRNWLDFIIYQSVFFSLLYDRHESNEGAPTHRHRGTYTCLATALLTVSAVTSGVTQAVIWFGCEITELSAQNTDYLGQFNTYLLLLFALISVLVCCARYNWMVNVPLALL